MFDSLRDSGLEDEEAVQQPAAEPITQSTKPPFLGMTAGQRFIIALLMLMMVCVLGVFVLILTQKVFLPFF